MNDKYKLLLFGVLLTLFISYSSFLYIQQPIPTPSTVSAAENGKMVWQQYNCTSCHQIYGLGGFLGPDLTNEYSKRGEDIINAFLMSGTNIMPNFHLSEQQRADLVEYLKNIDQTGKSDPKTFTINADGTIEQ